jgi:hypothetical protein
MAAKEYDHTEVTCDAMWEFVLDTLPAGTPRYCCVCEGHHCPEAVAERKRVGLPPPPLDAWCKYIAPNALIQPTPLAAVGWNDGLGGDGDERDRRRIQALQGVCNG